RTLAFTAALSALTGLILGTLPALRATRSGAAHGLHHDALTSSHPRRLLNLRDLLVVGQVAISSALLVVTGLFVQSLVRAQSVDLGFQPEHVALVTLDLEAQGYPAERAGQFLDTLEETVRRLPGVRSAAFARFAPLGVNYARRGIRIEGYQPRPSEDLELGVNAVDEDYFATLGIELLDGRAFHAGDRQGTLPVAIVNEAFVRRYWPDGKALGKHIDAGGVSAEVVGVAADAKYRSIRDDALPYFYLARRQTGAMSGMLEVRTEGDPSAIFPALRTSVSALDPRLPFQLTTMNEHLGSAVLAQRIGASLIGVLGGLGVLLAAFGLYGVLSYLVVRRAREIGIRMALGSDAATIMRMVLKRAAGLTGVGLAIGLAGALAAGRLVAEFLFDVDARDPVTFVAVAILFAAIALSAAMGPARRATHVDPTEALRSE
ncbi:MAG TPA: FtsX-like permease family protein, partial [Gammaproteobacteria bacterium]|nr:FtsX-like permease family protein [Gammaproteobacteria bacterium]